MAGNFFKGTSTEQDSRFGDKERKLIINKQWPEIFDQQVNMKSIDMNLIKPWVEKKVIQYIGIDDEVVQSQILNYLEQNQSEVKGPDPKALSIQITGYFEKNTMSFMTELWQLLLETQNQKPETTNQSLLNKKQEWEEKRQELTRLKQKLQVMEQAMERARRGRRDK